MKTTELYDLNKLPSWVSKPKFEGSENIKIKSRENALDQIKDFINLCKNQADGCNTCAILGEWGQGKTEIYNGFIEPFLTGEGDYSFFLSASTLANLYENEELSVVSNKCALESERFLANLFEGIRAESRKQEAKSLPSLKNYVDLDNYMDDVFENLLDPYDGSKKIFIFIDEVEELLLNMNALKKIINGIKTTINGQYGVIDIKGKYEGSIHIFISITPDARYKLEVSEDTSLIMGGVGRRLTEVELTEIRKEEGINFLKNLLEHIYNYDIPTPYPIENYGLFNTLFRISQRNVGNLVKLFSEIFNYLEKDGKLQILNYNNLLDYLESNKIYVFGSQTPCIEKEMYYNLQKSLIDQPEKEIGKLSLKLFKLFLGDLLPLNIKNLSQISEKDDSLIYHSISVINNEIHKREKNLEFGIIKYGLLEPNITIKDIFNKLNFYIKTDEKIDQNVIEIGNFSESLESFEDRISSFSLDENGELNKKIFLPYDEKDVRIFFRDEINNNEAIALYNIFKNLRTNEVYYAASDMLLDLIYPTPVPRFLDYILNKEVRLDLWRKITRNLDGEFINKMPMAFVDSLERSNVYKIIEKNTINNYTVLKFHDLDLDLKINTLVYSVFGNVKEEDIDFISNYLNDNLDIHLVIIIYTGEYTANAKQNIKNKGLDKNGDYKILDIHLHPTLSKRIICSYKSLEYPKSVDYERLSLESKDIILREISIKEKIMEWLKEQSVKGIVINQISTSNLRKFADCLKLYINYLDEPTAPKDILEKNLKGVLNYRIYGPGTGLITNDFEDSPKEVITLSTELYQHGYLDKDLNDLYSVITNPIENKVYEIIKKQNKIVVQDLYNYFIVKDKNKKIFEDVFLNILSYKGKIYRDGKFYVLLHKEKAYDSLKKEYEVYQKTYQKNVYDENSHFYVSKQNKGKLIYINDFDEYLNDSLENIESYQFKPGSDDIAASKIQICSKLIQIFNCKLTKGKNKDNKCFSKAVEGAARASDKIFESDELKKNDIDRSLDSIIDDCKKRLNLYLRDGKESIEEYNKVKIYFNQLEECYKGLNKEKLENIIKSSEFNKEEFKFDKSLEDAHYFNLNYYEIEKISKSFIKQIDLIKKLKYRVDVQLDSINSMQGKLENQLKSFPANEKYRMSYYAFNEIINANIEKSDSEKKSIDTIKLAQIEKISKNALKDIEDKYSAGLEILQYLKDLLSKEQTLNDSIVASKERIKEIDKIFDIKELKIPASKFKNKILRIEKDYLEINTEELEEMDDNPTELLQRWDKVINIANCDISNTWEEYTEINMDSVRKVNNLLSLLQNIPEIEDDLLLLKTMNNKFKKVNSQHFSKIDKTASELENEKKEILDKIEKLAKTVLDDNELNLLKTIQSIKINEEWIEYKNIEEEALKNGMTVNEMDKSFEGLISKGYLRRGFSLL